MEAVIRRGSGGDLDMPSRRLVHHNGRLEVRQKVRCIEPWPGTPQVTADADQGSIDAEVDGPPRNLAKALVSRLPAGEIRSLRVKLESRSHGVADVHWCSPAFAGVRIARVEASCRREGGPRPVRSGLSLVREPTRARASGEGAPRPASA
jgi:hypothetical protein